MLGREFRCSGCDFDFCSGWSHREGGQLLVCRGCGEYYVLGGGQSCWGVEDGEMLELFREHGDGVSTGIRVRVRKQGGKGAAEGISVLEFEKIACPGCGKDGMIVQSLEIGGECPKCHVGKIVDGGICIY